MICIQNGSAEDRVSLAVSIRIGIRMDVVTEDKEAYLYRPSVDDDRYCGCAMLIGAVGSVGNLEETICRFQVGNPGNPIDRLSRIVGIPNELGREVEYHHRLGVSAFEIAEALDSTPVAAGDLIQDNGFGGITD
jgi:hypothetical protein